MASTSVDPWEFRPCVSSNTVITLRHNRRFDTAGEEKVYTTTAGPLFLGLSPDPEVTEQKKLWCIPFSWENKGKGYTP